VTDVFTPERVELLGVLASQAAISIDNARLYRMLKKALAQARESMQAKNELLARTSHELRTPLNAIINLPCTIRMGYHACAVYRCSACQGLFEGAPGGEDGGPSKSCPACQGRQTLSLETRHIYDGDVAEVYQALDIIEQAGQRLLQIVSNLLDLSELESQRLQLSLDEIEVAQLVGKVLELVSPMAAKQDIRITSAAIPEDLKIRGDYLKLGRVLFNLLDNAIKFSPRGGEVSLVFDAQEREVCFRIGDRGIGIAEKDRGVIFDSFRQVEEEATRRYGGAGLGLSIAKSLVELHEGNIEVVSELGRGSTFLVHLPRDKAGDRSDPPTRRVP
jgi:signal transduction histidine kinase